MTGTTIPQQINTSEATYREERVVANVHIEQKRSCRPLAIGRSFKVNQFAEGHEAFVSPRLVHTVRPVRQPAALVHMLVPVLQPSLPRTAVRSLDLKTTWIKGRAVLAW